MIRPHAIFISMIMCAACQSQTTMGVPATLSDASDATLESLKQQIAEFAGLDDVRLRSEDFTSSSTVTAVPAPLGPLETHSTAVPIRFDLVLDGETCFAVRRDTKEKTALIDISCRAL